MCSYEVCFKVHTAQLASGVEVAFGICTLPHSNSCSPSHYAKRIVAQQRKKKLYQKDGTFPTNFGKEIKIVMFLKLETVFFCRASCSYNPIVTPSGPIDLTFLPPENERMGWKRRKIGAPQNVVQAQFNQPPPNPPNPPRSHFCPGVFIAHPIMTPSTPPKKPLFPRKENPTGCRCVRNLQKRRKMNRWQLFAQMAIDSSFYCCWTKGPSHFSSFEYFFALPPSPSSFLSNSRAVKKYSFANSNSVPINSQRRSGGKKHTSEKHHLFLVQKIKVGKHFFQNAF